MINGIVRTYENSSMSLSCHAEMKIEDSIVTSVFYNGMPRANGIDRWMKFYEKLNGGEELKKEDLDYILGFNGRNNVVSVLEVNREVCDNEI